MEGKEAMRKRLRGGDAVTYILSISAICLWGASYIWSNSLIGNGIPIFYFVFVRIFLAGLILLLLNIVTGHLTRIERRDLPWFLLLSLCEPFIYFLCETYGIKETGSPTISAMTIATIPIFSILAGVVFFREKVSPLNVFGTLLSLGGIILVAMARGELGSNFVWGIALLLVAVIAEVCHASITKKLSGGYSSQVIVMYQFLIGSVYLLPLFIFKGLDGFSAGKYFSSEVIVPILCLSLLCSSLAFSLWVGTIKKLGVAKSSIFSALIPVVSAVIAGLLGQEMLSGRQWTGVAVCTVGVVLSQMNAVGRHTADRNKADAEAGIEDN